MSTNYLAHLIDLRFVKDESHISVAQAFKIAGVVNIKSDQEGKEEKHPSNKVALQQIQQKLIELENNLFNNSTDYQELVKLQNCWKRINNQLHDRATAQKIRRDEKIQKKRGRCEVSQGLSSSQDNQKLLDNEVSAVAFSHYPLENKAMQQQILDNQKVLQQMLENQILDNQKMQLQILDNQKTQTDFLKNECKLNQIYSMLQTSCIDRLPLPKSKDHSSIFQTSASKTNDMGIYKGANYGVGAKMLCSTRLGGNGTSIPKSLGKHGGGIESPIRQAYRETNDKSGVGTSRTSISLNAPAVSVITDELPTAFGKIYFQNDANFRCYYKINVSGVDNYMVHCGMYGLVLFTVKSAVAYKIIFCQENNGSGTVRVMTEQGFTKELQRSSYMNAIYESKANKILLGNEKLRNKCILVNGNNICIEMHCMFNF